MAVCLPVPVLAATGLSIPLPPTVERLAAALVPWAGAANVEADSPTVGADGSIVLTPRELAQARSARHDVALFDVSRNDSRTSMTDGKPSRKGGKGGGTATGGTGSDPTGGSSSGGGGSGGSSSGSGDPGATSEPGQTIVDQAASATQPVVDTAQDAVDDPVGTVGDVVEDAGGAATGILPVAGP